jgi:hypothetical protein
MIMSGVPKLEHVCDLTVQVGAPLEAGPVRGLNSAGLRRIIPITGGVVRGAHLNGVVMAGGADFQLLVSDTAAELDARYILELDGGAKVYVHNRAIRRGTPEQISRLFRGEAVDPEALYFRCMPSFEVSDGQLRWLTESVFIGTGARYPDRVEMAFFRVL